MAGDEQGGRTGGAWPVFKAMLTLAGVAFAAQAAWHGAGRPLCAAAWQGVTELLTLQPAQAVAWITGLVGG